MKKEILDKLVEIKSQLNSDGFIIEGVFGSYVRDEFTQFSDINILYELKKSFKSQILRFLMLLPD